MKIKKTLIYDGSKLKQYLAKHNMTYQDAADKLCVDKNTVGKAVRGGNLNTSVLLKICNEFGLNIYDFFTVSNSEDTPFEYGESIKINSLSEDELKYTSVPNLILLFKNLLHSKDEEIKYLQTLIRLYSERIELLQNGKINDIENLFDKGK